MSTFERDFVDNIVTKQAAQQQEEAVQNEDVSVSTFEKDFMAREAKGLESVSHAGFHHR